MDIAVRYHPGREQVEGTASREAAATARIEVFTEMAEAEPYWRRLEASRPLSTPYQGFDLLAAWQRHVGSRTGVMPFIVTGFDRAGEPLFLWPFGRIARGPLNLVRFLGSKHSNFNMGLWRRDLAVSISARDLDDIFDRAARGRDVDLVALHFQPASWNGIANPFHLLPHQASVDASARQDLSCTPDAIKQVLSPSMQTRLRTKERKLQHLAGYRYTVATTTEEIDGLLDNFFSLKSAHMAAQGLGNAFAETGVAEFLREACHRRLPTGGPLIEIHALEGGGETLALFGTISDDYRISLMFNTYTLGHNARHSPGLILLVHMVNASAARGVRSLDLGVGQAHYKTFFCREPEPLFDTFLPLTARGRLAAAAFGATFAVKRTIKNTPALWSVVQLLRHMRART